MKKFYIINLIFVVSLLFAFNPAMAEDDLCETLIGARKRQEARFLAADNSLSQWGRLHWREEDKVREAENKFYEDCNPAKLFQALEAAESGGRADQIIAISLWDKCKVKRDDYWQMREIFDREYALMSPKHERLKANYIKQQADLINIEQQIANKRCYAQGQKQAGSPVDQILGSWKGEYKNSNMKTWKSSAFSISGAAGGYQATFPAGTIDCEEKGSMLACKGEMGGRYYHEDISFSGDKVTGVNYKAWKSKGGALLWVGSWQNIKQ